MSIYRSKPQEVEAVQWDGDNFEALMEFQAPVQRRWKEGTAHDDSRSWDLVLYAGKGGAQGFVDVPDGHWIVRQPGDHTDHWPVDPDYFAAKYEAVPEA